MITLHRKLISFGIAAGLLLTPLACQKQVVPAPNAAKQQPTKSGAAAPHDHSHDEGPHDGVVAEWGNEQYHAEFTVDHDKKECTLLILGADEKTSTAVATKEFTLTTKQTKTKEGTVVPPMTIKMLPTEESGGKATKFVGTDPGLGNVADFEGTVIGEIDGKPSQGTFKEE